MVALSACPGRREVVLWASHWRRGRSGNAIGLTKFAHQSAVRARHGPYCSHTEERFSDIWRPHGDLVDSQGRHGRSVVAVLCDGGLKCNIWYWYTIDLHLILQSISLFVCSVLFLFSIDYFHPAFRVLSLHFHPAFRVLSLHFQPVFHALSLHFQPAFHALSLHFHPAFRVL